MFDPGNPATLLTLEATVFDSNDEKVGKVAEINRQDDYMLLEKGWLFHKDFYVPFSAVMSVDEDGAIHLNLNKRDLEQGKYDIPPVNAATSTDSQANAKNGAMGTGRQPLEDDVFSKQRIDSPVPDEEAVAGQRRQDIDERGLR